MTPARSAGQVYGALFRVLLFLVIIGFGLFWSRDQLVQFFMARAWINGIILALAIIALFLCLAELFSLLAQSRRLEGLIDALGTNPPRETIKRSITDLKPGLVKNRCDRIIQAADQNGFQAIGSRRYGL